MMNFDEIIVRINIAYGLLLIVILLLLIFFARFPQSKGSAR